MAAKFSILSLSAVLASAPLGSCQYNVEWSILGESDVGVFGIPTEEYAGMEVANATGIITIPDNGYNLTIAVKADVPLADTTDTTMTTTISLEMSEAVRNLTTCVVVYEGLAANISAAATDFRTQDGSRCDSILTDECLDDLSRAHNTEFTEDCSGFEAVLPESCRDQFDSMDASSFSIQSADDLIFYQHGSAPAAPGNETLWQAAATHIWPVFIMPVRITEAGWSTKTSFSCIRPDTFKEATVGPSAEPNGTQSGGAAGTGTTAGATPSPTNAASQAGLTVTAAVVGLIFNAAMLFM